MKKIALVWELGSGLGHIMQLLSLAKRLKAQGHELHFLVLQGFDKHDLLQSLEASVHTVPLFPHTLINMEAIKSFSELLLNNGFRDLDNLKNRIKFWHEKFLQINPDLIIADHSPSAVLTAYILNIPYVLIGNRFFIPPNISPFPSIKYWENISEIQLIAFDQEVLNNINQVCNIYRVKILGRLQDLYANAAMQVLQTYAELDPYQNEDVQEYHGLCVDHDEGIEPVWKTHNKPKVLIYLRQDHPNIKQILLQLTKIDAEFLIRMNLDNELNLLAKSFDNDRITIVKELLDIDVALEQCDILVCHGNHTITMQALLKGKPVLCAPRMFEHQLTARHLSDKQLGLAVDPTDLNLQPARQLRKLLEDKTYFNNTNAFKEKYSAISIKDNIDKIAMKIACL